MNEGAAWPEAGAAPDGGENMHFILVKGRSDNKILINLDQIAAVRLTEEEDDVYTTIALAGRPESILAQEDIRGKIKSAILAKGGAFTDLT